MSKGLLAGLSSAELEWRMFTKLVDGFLATKCFEAESLVKSRLQPCSGNLVSRYAERAR